MAIKTFGTRTAAVLGVIILAGASATAGEGLAATGDLARLQGKWECRAGAARELQVTLNVSAAKVDVVIQTPQGLVIRSNGELKLDESATPRRVDWVGFKAAAFQDIPEIQGVYKLDGDDFVLCNGGFNGARPTEFEDGDGPLAEVLTFRRPGAPQLAEAETPSEPVKPEW